VPDKPKVNIPAQGTFEPPPPGAPVEVSQPLHPSALASMQAQAEANEKALAPLKFAIQKGVASAAAAEGLAVPGGGGVPIPTGPQTAPPSVAGSAPAGSAPPLHGSVSPPGVPPSPVPEKDPAATATGATGPAGTGTPGGPPEAALQGGDPSVAPSALPPLPPDATPEEIADPVVNARPGKGYRPIQDPGKVITGGWGLDASFPAQYYALDGSEIRAIALRLWEDVKVKMEQDLRFHLAACYPQALVRVSVEVAGATAGAAVNDVAFTLASKIVVLEASLADTPDTPADALRVDTGLPRPYKHAVKTPTGTYIVDQDVDAGKGV